MKPGITGEGTLTERARSALSGSGATESRVLGGVGFFLADRMVAAVIQDRLCLPGDGSTPFEFAGRAVPGWMAIESTKLDDEGLARWLSEALARVETLGGED